MKTDRDQKFKSAEIIRTGFEQNDYICSGQMATTLYLAYHLDKPVLVDKLGVCTACTVVHGIVRAKKVAGESAVEQLCHWLSLRNTDYVTSTDLSVIVL